MTATFCGNLSACLVATVVGLKVMCGPKNTDSPALLVRLPACLLSAYPASGRD